MYAGQKRPGGVAGQRKGEPTGRHLLGGCHMRRVWNLALILVLGVASPCVFTTGCDNKTEEVTIEGKRGKETTYEVEKDRQGNVTEVKKQKK